MRKTFYTTTTTTTYSCPHCGHNIKSNIKVKDDVNNFVLGVFFFPIFLVIGIYKIGDYFASSMFNYIEIQMGSSIIKCENCGAMIDTKEKIEWAFMNKTQKKIWTFRHLSLLCRILSGSICILIIPAIGTATTNDYIDHILSIIFFSIIGLFVAIICLVYLKWNVYKKQKMIVVSESDFNEIEKSWIRVKKYNPNMKETEKIKIYDTGEIIYPKKGKR